MKKLLSVLIALALVACCACSALAETAPAAPNEMGNPETCYDYTKGNFESVTGNGSVAAKIYVTGDWTYTGKDDLPMANYYRDTGIEAPEDGSETLTVVQNLNSALYTAAEDGIATIEEFIAAYGEMYTGELCTVNGVRAFLFNSEGKYILGGAYELEEGLLVITVDGIVNEDLENEAVLILCSLVIGE